MKKLMFLFAAGMVAVSMSSCSDDDLFTIDSPFAGEQGGSMVMPGSSSTGSAGEGTSATAGSDNTDVYTDTDDDISGTSFDKTITVTFASGGASVSGDTGGIVSVDGNDVVVNNTGSEKIMYVLKGSASDGFFKLYSSKKQAIKLSGLTLTNKNGAAINNQSGKRTFVVVEGVNTISDGSDYSDEVESEDMKAAFFSEGQLIFSGSGTLTVNAQGKAGITSDDYIRFMDENTTIKVNSSAGHAIRGKDAIIVSAGNIEATASAEMKKAFSSDSLVQVDGGVTVLKVTGNAAYDSEEKDVTGTAGIKADMLFIMNDGELTVTNTGKGGKGISCDGPAYFKGGKVSVTTTGSTYKYSSSLDSDPKGIKVDGDLFIAGGDISVKSSSSEGIEAKGAISITGGNTYSYASDDAINSKYNLVIDGGVVYAHSTGNDAVDANNNLIVNGGIVIAEGAGGAESGLDAAERYAVEINGGTVISVGGRNDGISNVKQACISSSVRTNTWLAVYDDSKLLFAYKTPSTSNASTFIASSPSFKSGSSYTLKTGVSVNGQTGYYGVMYTDASVSGGSSSTVKAATSFSRGF